MNKSQLERRVTRAVRQFWSIRRSQGTNQGRKTGRRDQGARSAVTGGKQLDGFIALVNDLLVDAGVSDHAIYTRKGQVILPGYFRPTKEWDLIVVVGEKLLATLEFKSQVGPSFGNNFNNRTEEAMGSATDLWTAYREGALKQSPRPWLGYFMLLEEADRSTFPVRVAEPHFEVFPEFRDASYALRYQVFCQRLVRERLYDASCLLLSSQKGGRKGAFVEPLAELSFLNFAASLTAHAGAYARMTE